MGAERFSNHVKGKSPEAAFAAAVEEAQYEHGHARYSGTIAEKESFVVIGKVDSLEAAITLSDKLMADDDHWIQDKWGPAGCICVKDGSYFFFG